MADEEQKTQWGKNAFVFIVIAFCLAIAAIMGFDQGLTTKVSEIVADGLISLALFVAVSYLASYSVDYSGVLNKIGTRASGRYAQPVSPQYQSMDPQYGQQTYYQPPVAPAPTIPGTQYSEDEAKG